jgi:hypothetical protein
MAALALERGLCDPETAAEYVGRKLLSSEAFAQARKEYQGATANYAPPYHAGFTLRKPDERALLEIWHIGYGPNVSYGSLKNLRNLRRKSEAPTSGATELAPGSDS